MNDAIIYATLSAFAPDVLVTIQHQVAYGITPDRIAEIFGGDAGQLAKGAAQHIKKRPAVTASVADDDDQQ